MPAVYPPINRDILMSYASRLSSGHELEQPAMQLVNAHLFLPKPVEVEPVDIWLVLGSRRCEYRVKSALERYGFGSHRFVLSGGGRDQNDRCEGDRMRSFLLKAGCPEDQIWCETASLHTRQNLAHTKVLLEDRGLGGKPLRISLVTGGFHMRRTLGLLREEWQSRSHWEVSPYSAYGPRTHPDTWHHTEEGRGIIGRELMKVLKMKGEEPSS